MWCIRRPMALGGITGAFAAPGRELRPAARFAAPGLRFGLLGAAARLRAVGLRAALRAAGLRPDLRAARDRFEVAMSNPSEGVPTFPPGHDSLPPKMRPRRERCKLASAPGANAATARRARACLAAKRRLRSRVPVAAPGGPCRSAGRPVSDA